MPSLIEDYIKKLGEQVEMDYYMKLYQFLKQGNMLGRNNIVWTENLQEKIFQSLVVLQGIYNRT